MGDFKKRFGGHGGGFNRRGGFGGGRDRGPVTMHQATCDQCGKSCEVPFKPTGDKPVYCSICFEGKKETGYNRGTQKSYDAVKPDISKGSNDELKKQLEILNVKMDRLINAVEAISNIKPLAAKVVKSIKKVSKK